MKHFNPRLIWVPVFGFVVFALLTDVNKPSRNKKNCLWVAYQVAAVSIIYILTFI